MIDKEALMELGLTTNEVEIYLKLLGKGSVTVNELATGTGLYRQACYDALDRLLEKGFVSFIMKDGKKHFQALDPEKLVQYAEHLKQRIAESLPELKKIAEPTEKAFVEVYSGKKTLRTVLKDIVETLKAEKTEVMISGVEEMRFLEQDKNAMDKYISDMRKFGFKEKLLTGEDAEVFLPGQQSEYRLLPAEFFNPNPTYIYGGKVVFMIWGSPTHAIVIRNKEVADANRKYFKMLWGIAKPRNRTKAQVP